MQCISVVDYNERYTPTVWDFPNITRPFSILYYALGGSAYYTFHGVEKPFEKDHLYILPVNKHYSLREDPEDKFYLAYIHAYTSPEIDTVISVDVREDPFLADTLTLIRRYIKQKNSIYIQKLTDMLLSYLYETAVPAQTRLPERIKAYIDENFIGVYQHSDLSSCFNYSRAHLTKIFREAYNLTPRQYARQCVLRETVLLLRQGLSIAEISERLAFSSPENLSRFFRGCYGYPPTEYIKRFKDFPA